MAARSAVPALGRHVYGLAAIALGLTLLVWGDFANVWHPVRPGVPYRMLLPYVVGACLLAGGVALQVPRSARAGALSLAVLYLLAALLWLPRIVGYPHLFGTWSGFAEQFVVSAAAFVAYASWAPRGATWAAGAIRAGRVAFGICVLALGWAHFSALAATASMVPAWIPPGRSFWAIATGAAFLLAGVAIVAGQRAVLASRLLAAMLGGFAALVWVPSIVSHSRQQVAWTGFIVTLAAAGAAWLLADVLRSARVSTR